MPAQLMWIYGHPLSEVQTVLAKLTVCNWAVVLLCLTCALLSWRASPSMRYLLPALLAAVASTLGFTLGLLPLVHCDVRPLWTDPKRRWWLRADRTRVTVPVSMRGPRQSTWKAETFDISETGVFIPFASISGKGELQADQTLAICFTFGALTQLRCDCRVVRRREEAVGQYPAGIGLEFTNLDRRQRRELKRYLLRRADTH